MGRAFIGSVADRVAQASTVPVMLIHPRAEDDLLPAFDEATCRRMVVPLDGSERARSALPVATRLARQLGAGIHLIRVVPSRRQILASRDAGVSGNLYQRLVQATRAEPGAEDAELYYQEYTESISDALGAEAARVRAAGVDTTSELLIGSTVASITDALTRDDVIVMTSHGQGGVRRWLMGSVAEKLIHMAAAPIVLVPDPARKAVTTTYDEEEWPHQETICPD
jgi:nucleotide-binding universal stress UspA family protein